MTLNSVAIVDAKSACEVIVRTADQSDLATNKTMVSEMTSAAIAELGRGLALAEADFAGLDLTSIDLRKADLSRANLTSTDLSNADLREATMICPLMERTKLVNADLRGFYAHAISIVSSDASGANLSGAIDTTGALFHGVKFVGATLAGGNFAGATFYQCDLTGADLSGAVLSGATFNECLLFDTDFSGAVVDELTITRCQAKRLSFDSAYGEGLSLQSMTQLRDVRAKGASLPALRVRNCTVNGIELSEATVTSATFERSSIVGLALPGANASALRFVNVTAMNANFDRSNLEDASFIDSNLMNSTFIGARAENAHLTRCSLTGSKFAAPGAEVFSGRAMVVRDSDLSDCDFRAAYLYRASFTGDPVAGMALDNCDFEGANLIQAYVAASLVDANLRGALAAYIRLNQSDLTSADLSGANLYDGSLVKTVLRGARMVGIKAPVFVDRCPGLDTAELDDDFSAWLRVHAEVLRNDRRGST